MTNRRQSWMLIIQKTCQRIIRQIRGQVEMQIYRVILVCRFGLGQVEMQIYRMILVCRSGLGQVEMQIYRMILVCRSGLGQVDWIRIIQTTCQRIIRQIRGQVEMQIYRVILVCRSGLGQVEMQIYQVILVCRSGLHLLRKQIHKRTASQSDNVRFYIANGWFMASLLSGSLDHRIKVENKGIGLKEVLVLQLTHFDVRLLRHIRLLKVSVSSRAREYIDDFLEDIMWQLHQAIKKDIKNVIARGDKLENCFQPASPITGHTMLLAFCLYCRGLTESQTEEECLCFLQKAFKEYSCEL